MRRTILLVAGLLAVLADAALVGSGVLPSDLPAATSVIHELAAADGHDAAAFVRSGAPGLGLAWQDGSGSGPGPAPRRADARLAVTLPRTRVAGRLTACRARVLAYLDFSAPSALQRAGHIAFHTTTPPPFRIV